MVHISVGVHLANIDPCVHVQNNNKKHTLTSTRACHQRKYLYQYLHDLNLKIIVYL